MPEYRASVLPLSSRLGSNTYCPAIKIHVGRIRMIRRDVTIYADDRSARLRAEGLINFLSISHFSLEDMARLAILFPVIVESAEDR